MAWGSVTPSSVPAILEVYPEMKWNMVCAEFNLEIGGSTPRASQVNRIILLGWLVEMHGILALWINSIGYALV